MRYYCYNEYDPESPRANGADGHFAEFVEADVLSRTNDRLVLAINTVKVTLTKNASGMYVGKMLGMSLKSDG